MITERNDCGLTSQLDQVLAPCPFCGCAVQFRKALWPSDGDTDAIIHAGPSDCGLRYFSIETCDEIVIDAWNERAAIRAAVGGEAVDLETAYKQWIEKNGYRDTHERSLAFGYGFNAGRASPPATVDVVTRDHIDLCMQEFEYLADRRDLPNEDRNRWRAIAKELAALIGEKA